jgi:inhibitor of cysteine peptidase
MKKYLLIATLSVMVLIAGCTSGQSTEVNTYTDPAQTINVNVNQEFILALESNPTTGYSWQESHDSTMLTLVNQEYKQREGSSGLVGAGGTEYIKYQALKKGEATVTLVYRRSWEQPNPTDKTSVFTVNIK